MRRSSVVRLDRDGPEGTASTFRGHLGNQSVIESGPTETGHNDFTDRTGQLMAGRLPEGRALVFDDDHYYMGAVVAERLRAEGRAVALVAPESKAAAWSAFTSEQTRTQKRLLEMGVEIVTAHGLSAFDGEQAALVCAYTGRTRRLPIDSIVLVTARQPNDGLFHALSERMAASVNSRPRSLRRIGDCDAPAIIAAAVYAGHRYARELDAPDQAETAFRHEPASA